MSGDTKSCGCLFSKGEHKIALLLNELNIHYKKEYIFLDYKNARFDFALLENDNVEESFQYDFGTTLALNTLLSWGILEEITE